MDNAQFEREVQYGAAVAIAKQLLRRELITSDEYQKLTVALISKYRSVVSSPQTNSATPSQRTVIQNQKGGELITR